MEGLDWPAAPAWSLAVGVIGRGLVFLGLACFVLSAAAWLRADGPDRRGRLGSWAFLLGAGCLFGAMLCIGLLFVNDQFQYEYVRARAAANTALKYKIAGIWSGQQGSFLLWGCASAIFGVLAARAAGAYRRWFTIFYAVFLGAICAILAYETPFNLTMTHGRALVPPDGAGLTPSLQNYWVVIHPPTIFLGFGSLAVLFCWAMSAMLTRNADDWVKLVRPWALVSLSLLGLGLCMGGFWAYETLGWGGFWMWDPVENVSFVPWGLVAAFIHGIFIQTTGRGWKSANLMLGGLPFLVFVYGTFLTRSGFLGDASVHSFAEMDRTALWLLLGFLGLSLATFLGVWFARRREFAGEAPAPEPEQPIHRQGLYAIGSMLLAMMSLAIGIGMSIPFFMSLAGRGGKVVEEHLYHLVVAWFFLPIMVLVAVAPFVSWRGASLSEIFNRVFSVLCLAIGATGVAAFFLKGSLAAAAAEIAASTGDVPAATIGFPLGLRVPSLPWLLVLVFLCLFAVIGNGWRIIEMRRESPLSWGGFVSHLGLATLLAGLIISRGFERQERQFVQEGLPARILDYVVAYRGHTSDPLEDRDNKVLFSVSSFRDVRGAEAEPRLEFTARPGFYFFAGNEGSLNPMVWPHIERRALHDIYFTLHPPAFDVWEQPQALEQGQTKTIGKVTVTYERLEMQGEPGRPGTRFVGHLKVKLPSGEVLESAPGLELTEAGLEVLPARVGEDMFASMQAMDVGSKSATFQLHFAKPLYPVEIFYKPMTGLVWTGTGILTLGGLMAAVYRRPRNPGAVSTAEQSEPLEDVEQEEHAPVTVA